MRAIRNLFKIKVSGASIHPSEIHQVNVRSADKSDAIKECQRQLYDIIMYNKTSWEEANNLFKKIKNDLKKIVKKHSEKGSCSNFEEKFLLSKIDFFSIPHFYIIW